MRFKHTRFRFPAARLAAALQRSTLHPALRACNADAAEKSDCAARDRPDRTEIRSVAVAVAAVAVAASAVAFAASAVAVAAPAVTAVSTSCATGTLFSALPAHYGERAKHSFCSGDGREARPHNWW
jgi:anti-sigma-K factor RskA